MKNLRNLNEWKPLAEGEVLEMHKTRYRAVKLHVSAPDRTRLFYERPGETPAFLAAVDGLDVIAFNIDGPIDIVSEGPIQYRCADSERVHVSSDGGKFTKIMTRAPRNPELEAIQHQMMRNMENRLAVQQAEFLRVMDQRQRADAEKQAAQIAELERSLEDDDDDESTAGDADEESESRADTGDESKPRTRKRAAAERKRAAAKPRRSPETDEESG